MKKVILFILLMLSVSLFLFAAIPTMDDLGGSNTSGGGTDSQEIQAEETIYMRANTSDVVNTLSNVYWEIGTLGTIYVYYWSQIPNGLYTGYEGESILSISNFTNYSNAYCTFDVTLPIEGSIPVGTTHISFYLGLVQDDSPWDYGDLGASEIDIVTSPTNYYTYMLFITDTTTETPTMVKPIDNYYGTNPTEIEFYLPETAYEGSVKLSFIRSGEDHECQIISEVQGTHNFNIDPDDLSASAEIQSVSGGNSLTANVPYTVTIEYQDELENPIASDSNVGYVYDTVTQAPILIAPPPTSTIGFNFIVEYNQPEEAYEGTVKLTFTRTGGSVDNGSPHVLEVTNETAGSNKTLSFYGNNLDYYSDVSLISGNDKLIDDAIYTIKIEYQDIFQNPIAYDEEGGIIYSFPVEYSNNLVLVPGFGLKLIPGSGLRIESPVWNKGFITFDGTNYADVSAFVPSVVLDGSAFSISIWKKTSDEGTIIGSKDGLNNYFEIKILK